MAAHDEPLDSCTVEADVNLVGLGDAPDLFGLHRPLQSNLEHILTIDREVMTNGQAAARSKWDVIAQTVGLNKDIGGLVDRVLWTDCRSSDGDTTDLPRRR